VVVSVAVVVRAKVDMPESRIVDQFLEVEVVVVDIDFVVEEEKHYWGKEGK
jgi:hypothetical protein